MRRATNLHVNRGCFTEGESHVEWTSAIDIHGKSKYGVAVS